GADGNRARAAAGVRGGRFERRPPRTADKTEWTIFHLRPVEFAVPAHCAGGGGGSHFVRDGRLWIDGGGRAGFGRRNVADFGAMAFDSKRILIMKTFKLIIVRALVFLA